MNGVCFPFFEIQVLKKEKYPSEEEKLVSNRIQISLKRSEQ